MIRVLGAIAAASLGMAVTVGCADDSDSATGEITVFAAASLNKAFTDLGKRFESQHSGASVTFNFAGSSDLATQLVQGAPADVFASANTANMTKVVDAGLVDGQAVDFASNVLTIVTAPGNSKGITSFTDLAKPGITVVVCAEQVPCGAATRTVEDNSGVTLSPVSEESQVSDVLGKVTSGQADAGLVYVTDAEGAGDKVARVDFAEAAQAVNTYPIATLNDSKHPEFAEQFVALVSGPEGREVLAAAGFAAP